MGACSSCLGKGRVPSTDDSDSRLLFDDPHSINYGSFGDQHPTALQADPQDVQREAEALQKIVAQTSNHLVDIFAMIPQNFQRSPSTFSAKDARLLQYQDVLTNLSGSNNSNDTPLEVSSGCNSQVTLEWASDDEDDEVLKNYKVNKPERTGPLLGGFSEIGGGLR